MPTVSTLYGDIDAELFAKFANIKLFVCDVDGVFSDGTILLGNNGEELKAFNTKDGYGIKALSRIGVDVAVITGRESKIVHNRMTSLNVKYIMQGREDKLDALNELISQHDYSVDQIASIGDDMPDLGMFASSAIGIAVADAHPMVKNTASFCTQLKGGRGAVREVCDLILEAKGELETIHGASV
ncbi:3-deoxy-manno-octulosonate-8-phosphatase KdsC [Glaciecola sp. MH2013]|uniref:3-deoxy-manno-octulosonate-8-phosphatase KdsC n=1 Tax=Glaciecola sp. MH2013 TaxID=2785524 RepID=UPI00189E50EE|nr:3-deoxy-manno-octulosonate-8-phosphatase KdsC [Glaciecola sp. MH2013]MBF7074912.1 3-deoxy-manno-octulosonate-8-phosphatase KdsC [Glaciecola sp. MH2013]